jgi:hypothetical protein
LRKLIFMTSHPPDYRCTVRARHGGEELVGQLSAGELHPLRLSAVQGLAAGFARRRAMPHAAAAHIFKIKAGGAACRTTRRLCFHTARSAVCSASSAPCVLSVVLDTQRIIRSSIGSMNLP